MAHKANQAPARNRGQEARVPAPQRDLHPMHSLRDEIDRLFEDFGSSFFPLWPTRRTPEPERLRGLRTQGMAAAPQVDVVERDKEYCITAEMPGMEEKDIDLVVAHDRLTIRGQKQEERTEERENYHVSERSYGAFQRTFQIPDDVDQNKIDATMKKGVLTVTLPKSEQARQRERRIEVKGGKKAS